MRCVLVLPMYQFPGQPGAGIRGRDGQIRHDPADRGAAAGDYRQAYGRRASRAPGARYGSGFLRSVLDNKKHGIYTCRFCGLPLFGSSAKFDSGTGWPSFFQPYDEAHIRRIRDTSYGMVRVEEVCARCGSHLGHVFADGPRPTGERHCLNSVLMSFTEQGHALPDLLQRGAPEGAPDAG